MEGIDNVRKNFITAIIFPFVSPSKRVLRKVKSNTFGIFSYNKNYVCLWGWELLFKVDVSSTEISYRLLFWVEPAHGRSAKIWDYSWASINFKKIFSSSEASDRHNGYIFRILTQCLIKWAGVGFQFFFENFLGGPLNRYRRKGPKVDESIFDSALSQTRRSDAA